MKDWKILTEAEITPYLNASQRDALASRADQGTANDPLLVSIAMVVERIRVEIRAHDKNVLSADDMLIPPELLSHAAYLVANHLSDSVVSFNLTAAQEDLVADAEGLLERISIGTFPVSIPSAPEAAPQVRTSFGPVVVSCRADPISRERLRGL